MRPLTGLLLCVGALAASDADGYFELGVDYLGKGFYSRARKAFGESLLRAPGQPVSLAFLGVAATAEGKEPATCAALLREAYRRLPAKKTLRLDLRKLLPSAEALALLARDYGRRLEKAKGALRRDTLTVLAFLQVHDGDPKSAPALDELRKEHPKDPYAIALAGQQPVASS